VSVRGLKSSAGGNFVTETVTPERTFTTCQECTLIARRDIFVEPLQTLYDRSNAELQFSFRVVPPFGAGENQALLLELNQPTTTPPFVSRSAPQLAGLATLSEIDAAAGEYAFSLSADAALPEDIHTFWLTVVDLATQKADEVRRGFGINIKRTDAAPAVTPQVLASDPAATAVQSSRNHIALYSSVPLDVGDLATNATLLIDGTPVPFHVRIPQETRHHLVTEIHPTTPLEAGQKVTLTALTPTELRDVWGRDVAVTTPSVSFTVIDQSPTTAQAFWNLPEGAAIPRFSGNRSPFGAFVVPAFDNFDRVEIADVQTGFRFDAYGAYLPDKYERPLESRGRSYIQIFRQKWTPRLPPERDLEVRIYPPEDSSLSGQPWKHTFRVEEGPTPPISARAPLGAGAVSRNTTHLSIDLMSLPMALQTTLSGIDIDTPVGIAEMVPSDDTPTREFILASPKPAISGDELANSTTGPTEFQSLDGAGDDQLWRRHAYILPETAVPLLTQPATTATVTAATDYLHFEWTITDDTELDNLQFLIFDPAFPATMPSQPFTLPKTAREAWIPRRFLQPPDNLDGATPVTKTILWTVAGTRTFTALRNINVRGGETGFTIARPRQIDVEWTQ